jgi:hypothetical protein
MKFLSTLITCTIAMCMQLHTQAQLTWSFAGTSANATGTIPNITTVSAVTPVNSTILAANMVANGAPASTGYLGATGPNNANFIAKTGVLNTSSATANTYLQFTLTPATNYWVNISAIKWGNFSLPTTGPTTLSIHTSLDNYATVVASITVTPNTTTWTNPSFNTAINGLTSTALIVRIYASGGVGTTPTGTTFTAANWRVDDLIVTAAAQTGTAGNIPKYTSPTTFANSIMAEVNNNIGVGNITPTEKLDVTGNLKISGAFMPNNAAGTTGQILTSAGAGAPPTWVPIASADWAVGGNSGTIPGTHFIGTTDAQRLVIKTGNIEQATVLPNGNVGIGNTTPVYKLDVVGNLKTTQDANINGLVVGKGTNGGIYSTAVGVNALNISTQNTAVGYWAGANITSATGNLNTAIGFATISNNVCVGGGNTAIGSYAMQYWASGHYNVGIGYDALHGAGTPGGIGGGTGFGNVGIGRKAIGAADVSGNYNVGLGYLALLNITSGSNNIGLGVNCGTNLTTGNNNILIGQFVAASDPAVSNELNIGNWIRGTNGNIGIGASTPQNKLEITQGTAGNSGLRFTNLTASSTAAPSSGKVLSVNANGDVVLEVAGGGTVPDGSETKIISGSPNVSVTGIGTIPSPYSIAVTNPASYWDASTLGTGNIVNNNAGGVIIGTGITTLSTGYRLYVTDGIITEKLKIRLKANWPDYVFNKDYPLQPLTEIEKYININTHRPGIQSAEDVKKEGIEVGETNALLLKKIEELTLYLITADREIKELQKKVNTIDKKN